MSPAFFQIDTKAFGKSSSLPTLGTTGLCVIFLCLGTGRVISQEPSGDGATKNQSSQYVSISAKGHVPIDVTKVVVTIPIRCNEDTHEEAIEQLRQQRLLLEETAAGLGCTPDHIHAVMYSIGPPAATRSPIALPGRPAPEQPKKVLAKCVVICVFDLEETVDQESTLGEAFAIRKQMTNVLPDGAIGGPLYRRSYASTTQLIDWNEPAIVFAGTATDSHRQQALDMAIETAQQKALTVAKSLGKSDVGRMRVSPSGLQSAYERPGQVSFTSLMRRYHPNLKLGNHPDQLVESVTVMASFYH
ncbi:MAG: SIMPL domain-containing protein [Planctomycetota bacterium]